MLAEPKPLFSLTAADLMSGSLVTVPETMSLKAAARQLTQAAVTGAPVVHTNGRCVGVISSTDFLHWMNRNHVGQAACATSPSFWTAWKMLDQDVLPDETVRDYMTRDPVMALATATIGELARKMINVHIHRVIIVDQFDRPIGIVSSTDILAAVAQASQIANSENKATQPAGCC